jgi:hypothetical protein
MIQEQTKIVHETVESFVKYLNSNKREEAKLDGNPLYGGPDTHIIYKNDKKASRELLLNRLSGEPLKPLPSMKKRLSTGFDLSLSMASPHLMRRISHQPTLGGRTSLQRLNYQTQMPS